MQVFFLFLVDLFQELFFSFFHRFFGFGFTLSVRHQTVISKREFFRLIRGTFIVPRAGKVKSWNWLRIIVV
jgi:hypothetical protein